MSVADLEALLESGGQGTQLADRLASSELTERVTPPRLQRWKAALQNEDDRAALEAVADLAAFRPLPPADLIDIPAPAPSEQTAMLDRATNYVRSMLPRLPNFFAQRDTTRFEFAARGDLEREQTALQAAQMTRAKLKFKVLARLGKDHYLFLVGRSRGTVTYRDGTEITTPHNENKSGLPPPPDPGLVTSGEFGAILAIVDRDAAQGAISWDHWERGSGLQLAVFRYSVPQEKSHFVIYTPAPQPGFHPEKHTPAYKGEIAIDPATGSIFRITVQAISEPAAPDLLSGVAVDYARISLGGRMFVCPVHATAVMAFREGSQTASPGLRRFLNDTTFTGYHLFGSDAHVVPEKRAGP